MFKRNASKSIGTQDNNASLSQRCV